MLSNYVTSAIRTGVPALVGWLAGWLLARGLDVPAAARDWAVGGLTFACLLVYYLAVRALELRWPSVGVFLGVPARPHYAPQGADGAYRVTAVGGSGGGGESRPAELGYGQGGGGSTTYRPEHERH